MLINEHIMTFEILTNDTAGTITCNQTIPPYWDKQDTKRAPYQWSHGEPDDLDGAVIVALRSEVVMLAGVSPRCGAGTVPAVQQH